jgi:hypothetical protein
MPVEHMLLHYWVSSGVLPFTLANPLTHGAMCSRVAYMGDKGWGLLAAAAIPEDALILEYAGDVVSMAEAGRRAKRYASRGVRHTYIMELRWVLLQVACLHCIRFLLRGGHRKHA